MSENQNFRSSFRGFHREDVVHYIEYLNNRYQTELNQLRGENQTLRAELDKRPGDSDRVEELEAALAQARTELEQARKALAQAKTETPADTGPELEAYRRAERTERMARERASLLASQADSALAEAREDLTQAEERLASVTMQTQAQIDRLREAVTAGRQTLARVQETLSDIAQAAK